MPTDNNKQTYDHKQLEVLIRLCEIAWTNFDRRRSYEWKLSLAIWTALTAFIALTLKGNLNQPPKLPFGVFAALIVCLQAFFLHRVKLANSADQKAALSCEKELCKSVGEDLDWDTVKQAREKARFIVHIGITLALILAAAFVAYKTTSKSNSQVKPVTNNRSGSVLSLMGTSKTFPKNIEAPTIREGGTVGMMTTEASSLQLFPYLIQIMLPLFVVIIAGILGYWKYLKQREHEQVTKRYLENGIDLLLANIEHALGVFKVNYVRSIGILKLFRDTHANKLSLPREAYSVEFQRYSPEAFYLTPLYKLEKLIGKDDVNIIDEAIQSLFGFIDTTTLFFQDDMCTVVREYVEGEKDRAPAQKIFEFYIGKVKEFDEESTKYYSILWGLQTIAWLLEAYPLSFKDLEKFKNRPNVQLCLKQLKHKLEEGGILGRDESEKKGETT